jgi:hypothetical protein
MKSYVKNFLILLIFISINGAIELAPKKYSASEAKNFMHQFPGVAAQFPIGAASFVNYPLPPEAKEYVQNYFATYSRISLGVYILQLFLIVIFPWMFVRLNRPSTSQG